MTSPARSHAAGLGIQTVPITNCAVTLPEDVIASVAAFHSRRACQQNTPGAGEQPGARSDYRPETLKILFGEF